ncbi:MAG: glycosyltransferase [Proteobacteria bacterium]|jgi:glycosyltransferase involved in cell wall biosynthesis|nr:glycosyltransferase [Pseudomonadota bacterium]
MKKTILIICFTDLFKDARVYRQILVLKDKFYIIAAGFTDPKILGVKFIKLHYSKPSILNKIASLVYLKLGMFECFYWHKITYKQAYETLRNEKFDLILANDPDTLQLTHKLTSIHSVPFIYDAHEYSPREFDNSFKWRFIWQKYKIYLTHKYAKQSSKMITVCDSIAIEYFKNFQLKQIPTVITNAPSSVDLVPLMCDESKIKIIHHGAAMSERGLDLMIQVANYLDKRFELVFMLVPTNIEYLENLKLQAQNMSNVKFVEPVAMQNIAKVINQYDIGLYLLPYTGFNNKYALPNKLFEFVQARLMLVIGPSPEMANIVNKYKLGLVADSFDPKSVADKLNALTTDEIMSYKHNSNRVAYELSAENNNKILCNLVEGVFNDNSSNY